MGELGCVAPPFERGSQRSHAALQASYNSRAKFKCATAAQARADFLKEQIAGDSEDDS